MRPETVLAPADDLPMEALLEDLRAIGAIGALMNRVLQPRPLVVRGLNVWMGTAAGSRGIRFNPGEY